MIPLHDNIPSRTVPIVNYTMIIICVLVFFVQLASPNQGTEMVWQYGMVPARITQPDTVSIQIAPQKDAPRFPLGNQPPTKTVHFYVPALLTLITCTFLHGGWMHLIGNMLFLFIFGDNVEDEFGHLGYLMFYLFSGVLAGLSHLLTGPGSMIPTIGASGAIAGVMGAYFIWYPTARVMTLIPILVMQILAIPAWIFLGLWMIFQVVQGSMASGEGAGVAWWAHIGGFAVGAAIAWVLLHVLKLVKPLNKEVIAPTDEMKSYRLRRRRTRRR